MRGLVDDEISALFADGRRAISELDVVRWHPRTAEISRDFTALKLEPFLEP
jgi:hypothetical protein